MPQSSRRSYRTTLTPHPSTTAPRPPPPGSWDLNAAAGQNFPASSNPLLGALLVPDAAPLHGSTSQGPTIVDAQGFSGFPKVTVDVSLALNDWLSAKPSTMTLMLPPNGPTISQLGVTNNPPTPIPVSRSTAECQTFIDTVTLTVNIGRDR